MTLGLIMSFSLIKVDKYLQGTDKIGPSKMKSINQVQTKVGINLVQSKKLNTSVEKEWNT